MPTSYDKLYSEEIVDIFSNNLRGEFGGAAKVYISENYKRSGNVSIRVGSVEQSFNEINDTRFLNLYSLEIKLYYILKAKNDLSYKEFFNTMHRIEQFLLAYQHTVDKDKNNLNLKINSITLNEFVDDEIDVNGLQSATFQITFSKLKG